MPIATQTVPVSLQGLDTKTDPKQVLPGKLTIAENVVFTQTGQLRKRNGFDYLNNQIAALVGVGFINSRGIVAAGNALLTSATGGMYAWTPASQSFQSVSSFAPNVVTQYPICQGYNTRSNADSAVVNGVRVSAWYDSATGNITANATDATTGNTFLAETLASLTWTGATPIVVTTPTAALIWYASGSNIYYKQINAVAGASSGVVATVNVVSDFNGSAWDVITIGNTVFLAYYSTVSTSMKVVPINATTLTIGTAATLPNYGSRCIGLWTDSQQSLWIAAGDASQLAVAQYTYLLSVANAFTVIDATLTPTRVTGCQYGLGFVWADDGSKVRCYFNNASSGISFSIKATTLGFTLWSRAFTDGQYIAGVWCSWVSGFQSQQVAFDYAMRPIAKANYLQGGGARTGRTLGSIYSPSTGVFDCAMTYQTRLLSVPGSAAYAPIGVNLARIDASAYGLQSARIRNSTVIASGVPYSFDGSTMFETGFLFWPEGVTTTPSTTGGTILAGSYLYRVTYEWQDGYGQTHRSASSLAVSATTTGSTSSVTVTIPTLKTTTRKNVRIAVYRTTASGSVFYRVSGANAVLNDATVTSVTFVDTLPDTSITTGELLYSTGGVLDPAPPPPSGVAVSWKNRLVVGPGADGNTLQYSMIVNPGEPVTFSDSLTLPVDPRGGNITGLGVIDEKLIIFKQSAIYVLVGDGPNNLGQQNDFTDPQLLTTDVGCVNARSIVITQDGLMFASQKGIYLLNRSLSVAYIGAPVESFNASTITGAALVPGTNQVRFTTTTGPTLVYDYLVQQWCTHTNSGGAGCDVWNGSYVYAQMNGQLCVEHVGQYTDGPSAPIRMHVRSGWISFAGLQGFQRVRRMLVLADYKSPHTLTVQVAHDYSPVFDQIAQFPSSVVLGAPYGSDPTYGTSTVYGGTFSAYQVRMHVKRQKCQAIMFDISDAQASNFGEGFALANVAFEVGIKPGAARVPAAQTV